MNKSTQNDRIREAIAWIETNQLDRAREILSSIVAPAIPVKPKSFESVTIDLGKGIRQFDRENPKAIAMSEIESCAICHVTLKFARIGQYVHPVGLGKYGASPAHLGCVIKAESREITARASEFDASKAAVCLCGHGFMAHHLDSLENYLECESRDDLARPDGTVTRVLCPCDHFRPGGTLESDQTEEQQAA